MTVARTVLFPSDSSPSSGAAARFGNAARAALVVVITALVLTLLGSAAHSWGGIAEGNPDPTQWTD